MAAIATITDDTTAVTSFAALLSSCGCEQEVETTSGGPHAPLTLKKAAEWIRESRERCDWALYEAGVIGARTRSAIVFALARAHGSARLAPDPNELAPIAPHHWRMLQAEWCAEEAKIRACARVAGVSEDEAATKAWLGAVNGGSGTPKESAVAERWPVPEHRFLVFTSAGDCNSVSVWVGGEGASSAARDFELCVVYYGDAPNPPCLRLADRSLRRRGGKFPNLLEAMRAQPAYFRSFEAIFVADDDLGQLGPDEIDRLFLARRELDAWVVAPANASAAGKADHEFLRARPGGSARFVNFVEVTAPLFETFG